MYAKKIMTIGTTAVVGVTSLGLTTFAVHADTKKAGDTIVSYTAQVQPEQWGVSVPANVDLTEKQEIDSCYGPKPGIAGKLTTVSITDEEGKTFQDPSKDRNFVVKATDNTIVNENMGMKSTDGSKASLLAKTSQSTEFTNSAPTLNFVSHTSGQDNVLSADVTFAGVFEERGSLKSLIPTKSYSTTISWTAQETTN